MKRLLAIAILVPAFSAGAFACNCQCCKRGSADAAAVQTATRAKDPVCGMQVDTAKALKSEYKGKTYYFCSRQCKDSFDKNPAQYAPEKN
jgi:YHS domain-containing protein